MNGSIRSQETAIQRFDIEPERVAHLRMLKTQVQSVIWSSPNDFVWIVNQNSRFSSKVPKLESLEKNYEKNAKGQIGSE